MTCDICEMIKRKYSFNLIYEDEQIIAMLHEAPAYPGHVLVMPKEHYRIIEEVPDDTVSILFNIANKISTALFESMNISGTNILANNGPEAGQNQPHFMADIIPRTEKDGINLEWPMEKSDFAKLESTFKFVKDFIEKSIIGNIGGRKVIEEEEKVVKSSEDDYMIRQLRRMP